MTLTKKHRAYFDAAASVARLSDFHRINIGCVVVYKHKIISSGFNNNKSNPLQKRLNKYRFEEDSTHSMHAETQALLPLINRRDIDFSHVQLYMCRRYKDGQLAPCRPCPSCMALIRRLGIRHIYYTNNNSYVYEELIY